MNINFPTREEMRNFSREHGLEYSDVVRDVVRLAAVANMRAENFLNEDCVLVGGMALRLRGSNRFTIFDTDSSVRKPPVDKDAVTDGLTMKTDNLEIEPKDQFSWAEGRLILTAKPVVYKAFFAGTATKAIEGEFSLTVSERGLGEAPEWLGLTVQSYPTLVFDPAPLVPVMQLDEQTAEKVLGWCGNSMAKHYVDLGWISRELGDELDGETLRKEVENKLTVNRKLIPAFRGFRDVTDLIPPLAEPEQYFGPLNRERDRRTGSLKFVGNGMSLDAAKVYIGKRIIPLLGG